MFEHLREHRKILVVGANRSGTTILATIIAHDTGHRLVVEEDVNFMPAGVEAFLAGPEPVVIQAPFMAHIAHQYPEHFIVFISRTPAEVEASKARQPSVFWPKFEMGLRQAYNTGDYGKTLMEIALENWTEQKERLPNHLTVRYDDLKEHPLFVSKRSNWKLRQTHGVG